MSENMYMWKNASGWNALCWNAKGATRLAFGRASKADAAKDMPGTPSVAAAPLPAFAHKTVSLLDDYFEGARVAFDDVPVDISSGSLFQQNVWNATRRLPYGATASYAEIAAMAGAPRATRAAGSALGANPLPVIIPCHRVIRADGSIGGFSIGVDVKEKLLRIEQSGKTEKSLRGNF